MEHLQSEEPFSSDPYFNRVRGSTQLVHLKASRIKLLIFEHIWLLPNQCASLSLLEFSLQRMSIILTNGFEVTIFQAFLPRYRTIFLKRFIQGLVFKGILKGQESKSWDFFEGPRRFRGPQKSEKLNFLKCTNKSADHKFKSFAIN